MRVLTVVNIALLAVFFNMLSLSHTVQAREDGSGGLDSEYYMDSDGGSMENLGGGEFLDSDGKITQTEGLGEDEYMTDSGDIILGDGEGEYMSADDESFRGMD